MQESNANASASASEQKEPIISVAFPSRGFVVEPRDAELKQKTEIKKAATEYLLAQQESIKAIEKAKEATRKLERLYHVASSVLRERNLIDYQGRAYLLNFSDGEFASLTEFGDGAIILDFLLD